MRGSVLIVEDEPLVAMELEDTVRQAGFHVRACVGSLEKALSVVRAGELDVAVLDCNLRGESIVPVAAALEQRHKPFLFVSGYGRSHLPLQYAEAPFVPKPFEPAALVCALENLLRHLDQ
jgi:DNA-binding response OmpR family regulator